MRMRVYIVAGNDGDLDRKQYAAFQYARNRGWHVPGSEDHAAVATKPGEHLPELLQTLSAGDVLVVDNIQSLGERPSQQEQIVRNLVGRGIRLHTIDLGGDINAHLPGLFAAWASAESVEHELEQAFADMSAMEARHRQDLQDYQEQLYADILRDGATLTVGKANGNGHADSELGGQIKSVRCRKNLSLRQLGELAGVSHSQLDRIERTGRGDGLEAVLAALGMDEHEATTT
jgi:hypothetical protein